VITLVAGLSAAALVLELFLTTKVALHVGVYIIYILVVKLFVPSCLSKIEFVLAGYAEIHSVSLSHFPFASIFPQFPYVRWGAVVLAFPFTIQFVFLHFLDREWDL
jgi:hypothetical protein